MVLLLRVDLRLVLPVDSCLIKGMTSVGRK